MSLLPCYLSWHHDNKLTQHALAPLSVGNTCEKQTLNTYSRGTPFPLLVSKELCPRLLFSTLACSLAGREVVATTTLPVWDRSCGDRRPKAGVYRGCCLLSVRSRRIQKMREGIGGENQRARGRRRERESWLRAWRGEKVGILVL